jgi:acyl-CoA reductase-like NAD-dependent aldehyde dehydrogenase
MGVIETVMGPKATEPQFFKALSSIEIAKSEGAELVMGGSAIEDVDGYFVRLTVFERVSATSRLVTVEVFGPVLAVNRSSEEEMIDQVNWLRYGRAGSVSSRHFWRTQGVVHRIESGHVRINDAGTHFIGMPFGGDEDSSLGREKSLEELISCSRSKVVTVKL